MCHNSRDTKHYLLAMDVTGYTFCPGVCSSEWLRDAACVHEQQTGLILTEILRYVTFYLRRVSSHKIYLKLLKLVL